MRGRTTALASLLFGGAIGYSYHTPITQPVRPPNAQVEQIAQSLRARGLNEEKSNRSLWHLWHKQYMYSQTACAHPQAAFWDPTTGVSEKYYAIPPEFQNHMDMVYPTIFDEGLAMDAFRVLPNHVGVTGTIELSELRPSKARAEDRILVLRASAPEGKGRKAVVSGELFWLDSNKPIASGKVVMIEPWWGKYMAFML